jgi:hypothetical protein
MKKIFTIAIVIILFSNFIFGQLGFDGHNPTNTLTQIPTGYSIIPTMRQNASNIASASSTITGGSIADTWVNFTFDTSGKNVYLVYTTDGTEPTKSNGTPLSGTFEYFSNPNRLWKVPIPSSVNVQGNNVKYVYYISDGTLAAGWGRVTTAGLQTTWTEGSQTSFAYTVAAPLPVQLSAFSVNPDRKVVNVSWSTAQEINNKQFEVERSKDLTDWISVGSVEGRGTTKLAQNYEFTDRSPDKGINYYRLKQIDSDGTFTYTRVKSAVIELNPDLALMPNPATEYLRIGGIAEPCNVEILDARGQVVLEKRITSSTDLGLNKLVKGVYFVRITDSISTKVSKILVEK